MWQNIPMAGRVPRSLEMYRRAGERIAGKTHLFGRRAELHAFGISPIYSDWQKDGRIRDVDGHEYVDFNLGAGAVMLGHAFPDVVEAVQRQVAQGTGLTLNHPLEIEAADLLHEIVPCAEMVRFCKGGGEADMVAVRIARAATGRSKIVFSGYHGWHDWYIAANLAEEKALDRHLLPGIAPLGAPKELAGTAIPFEFNNLDSLRRALEANRGEVAAVILEPARTFLPEPGFLEGVRDLAHEHGAVLIFDEVVTGFRWSRGGAQQYYGVTPDVATFAKCISNGFALGAVTGRRDIMSVAIDSFISSVYWAEATGLAAAKATLRLYRDRDVAGAVWRFGESFIGACRKLIAETGAPVRILGLPPLPTLSFDVPDPAVRDQAVTLYLQETARRGLNCGPGNFFCYTHTEADLRCALAAIGEALNAVARALKEGDVMRYLECPVRQSGFRRLV
jgi:glutamate-1-semialdehyde 2,1-aminomutase